MTYENMLGDCTVTHKVWAFYMSIAICSLSISRKNLSEVKGHTSVRHVSHGECHVEMRTANGLVYMGTWSLQSLQIWIMIKIVKIISRKWHLCPSHYFPFNTSFFLFGIQAVLNGDRSDAGKTQAQTQYIHNISHNHKLLHLKEKQYSI